MSDFWIEAPEAFAELEGESRRHYLHPWLRGRIHALRPRRVLDYGCGDGSLLRDIRGEFAELALHDVSPGMLALARQACGDHPAVRFFRDDADLPADHFDLVVVSLVLMTIGDRAELERVIRRVAASTAPGGSCLVAVTHPCFRDRRFSTFAAEYVENPFNYFAEGAPFRVRVWNAGRTRSVEFTDYHWSLGLTLDLFARAGCGLQELVELRDQARDPALANALVPSYAVFCLNRRT